MRKKFRERLLIRYECATHPHHGILLYSYFSCFCFCFPYSVEKYACASWRKRYHKEQQSSNYKSNCFSEVLWVGEVVLLRTVSYTSQTIPNLHHPKISNSLVSTNVFHPCGTLFLQCAAVNKQRLERCTTRIRNITNY